MLLLGLYMLREIWLLDLLSLRVRISRLGHWLGSSRDSLRQILLRVSSRWLIRIVTRLSGRLRGSLDDRRARRMILVLVLQLLVLVLLTLPVLLVAIAVVSV